MERGHLKLSENPWIWHTGSRSLRLELEYDGGLKVNKRKDNI